MTEHYVTNYIVILVGLLQCTAVGWIFEYDTTAKVSPVHAKSLRIIALTYWVPVVVFSFYANFAMEDYRYIGLICIAFCTTSGLIVSK